jgi:hypothetical protein
MRRALMVIVSVGTVSLIVGGVLLVREFNRGFPQLRPGIYAGTLVSKGGSKTIPWLVEASVGSSDLFIAVGADGVPAQRGVVVEPSSGTRLPLMVSGTERRFRITGREDDGGEYQGDYSDPITSESGTWTLKRFEVSALEKPERDDLVDWVATWQSLRAVEAKIEETKKSFDIDEGRIEKLHRYAVEDDSLQKAADSRLSTTATALDDVKRQNAAKRTELEGILRNIEISKRVSPEGRLVEMSRESINREAKWIEQALQLTAPEVSGGFEQDYERALRVKALQDQVSDERGLIRNLTEGPRYRGRSSERDSEEEFYNELR